MSRRRRRGGWRAARAALVLFAAVAAAWLGGLIWFGQAMPRRVADRSTPTDVIVVLTGGSERIKEGVRLLRRGRAGTLFVSGVNPRATRSEILRLAGRPPPSVARRIVLGYRAEHTRGNAAETALWVSSRNYRSLRLVTAHYHMRRSLTELRHALPEVRIIPHPVFPAGVGAGGWWRSASGLGIILKEYNKYLAAMIRLQLS